MENRRKTWEWSEEIKKKVIAKCGQCKGYKIISKEFDVPVISTANIIKKFKASGTVANISGCGHKWKIGLRLKRRVAWMMEKEPRKTSVQIQADLEVQGRIVSSPTICHYLKENGLYGGPRKTTSKRGNKIKPEWTFDKPKSFWENVPWTDETKSELFGKAHQPHIYRR